MLQRSEFDGIAAVKQVLANLGKAERPTHVATVGARPSIVVVQPPHSGGQGTAGRRVALKPRTFRDRQVPCGGVCGKRADAKIVKQWKALSAGTCYVSGARIIF